MMEKENTTHRIIRKFAPLLVLLVLVACTSDENLVDYKEETTTLQVQMTRAGGVEDQINNARMLVFNRSGRCMVNTTTPVRDLTFEALVPAGTLHVYLVANELVSWNLAAITTLEEFKAKTLTFTAYPVVGSNNLIPMLASYENVQTVDGDITYLTGKKVERMYAKATLNLYCTFADVADISGARIILDNVSVRQMPRTSYIYPASYTATTFFNGTTTAPTLATHGYNSSDNTGFTAKGFTFYIPEYIISDKTKYTYLSIQTHLLNNTAWTREYILPIGNGIASRTIQQMLASTATLAHLTVTRNTHYTFDATIKGFIEEADMTVNAKVVTWEGVELEPAYPTYLLTVSRDKVGLASGAEGSVYVTTDHPDGWKATIGNGSGRTTFVGYTSGTAVTASGYLTFKVSGAITTPDTVKVTAGNMTKKIIVTN